MARNGDYSIFEYLYRDAGNYKTHGRVLLAGRATPADEATVRASLDDACFVAEQVGIAPLQPQHLRDCGSETGELDHGFHEFAALRAAEAGDAGEEAARMTVVELVQRFREIAGRWDPGRSPFGR
ncbi:MAG: hypothetical protein L0H23_00405 [Luteimonas sp.]|nr:hypothetical protein [Luteimonas sp.]